MMKEAGDREAQRLVGLILLYGGLVLSDEGPAASRVGVTMEATRLLVSASFNCSWMALAEYRAARSALKLLHVRDALASWKPAAAPGPIGPTVDSLRGDWAEESKNLSSELQRPDRLALPDAFLRLTDPVLARAFGENAVLKALLDRLTSIATDHGKLRSSVASGSLSGDLARAYRICRDLARPAGARGRPGPDPVHEATSRLGERLLEWLDGQRARFGEAPDFWRAHGWAHRMSDRPDRAVGAFLDALGLLLARCGPTGTGRNDRFECPDLDDSMAQATLIDILDVADEATDGFAADQGKPGGRSGLEARTSVLRCLQSVALARSLERACQADHQERSPDAARARRLRALAAQALFLTRSSRDLGSHRLGPEIGHLLKTLMPLAGSARDRARVEAERERGVANKDVAAAAEHVLERLGQLKRQSGR
ncbi:MAG: hypothetical protein HY815_28260 [Candidatus Riflebacteria bacterium]|nr:hypothetical protein [Candidatus Riflebacteria bacterium]